MGKEYKFFKGKNQRVRIFKLIFVCMHHLIKSMRNCLREAISNDGDFIYYLQFLLPCCLMPVCFCIKLLFFFLYFAISSSFHFYYLNTYLITINNRKKDLIHLTRYLNFRDCISTDANMQEVTSSNPAEKIE